MVKQLKCLTHRLDGNWREGSDVSNLICFTNRYMLLKYFVEGCFLASRVFTEKVVWTPPQKNHLRIACQLAVLQDDIEVN